MRNKQESEWIRGLDSKKFSWAGGGSSTRCQRGRQEPGRKQRVCGYDRRRFRRRSLWWILANMLATSWWHATSVAGRRRTVPSATSVQAAPRLPCVLNVAKPNAWLPVLIALFVILVAMSLVGTTPTHPLCPLSLSIFYLFFPSQFPFSTWVAPQLSKALVLPSCAICLSIFIFSPHISCCAFISPHFDQINDHNNTALVPLSSAISLIRLMITRTQKNPNLT